MNSTGTRLSRLIGPPHRGRFAALEGYRGCAAMAVLCFHVAGSTGFKRDDQFGAHLIENLGNFGVALFFLLSGFLLYRPYSSAALEGTPAPAAAQFLMRRLVRIYPAYWLALIAIVVTLPERNAPNPLGSFLLLDSYATPVPPFPTLGVAWTLSIEVAFYVFLVIVGAILHRVSTRISRRNRRGGLQLVLLGLMYVSAVIFRWLAKTEYSAVWIVRWLPAYLDWFALGMLLALAVAWRDGGGRIPRAVADFANHAGACFACSAACYASIVVSANGAFGFDRVESVTGMSARFAFQGAAAFFALLPAILGTVQQPMLRALAHPIPATVGVISYGIYLWHTVVLAWVDSWIVGSGTVGAFAITTVLTTAITLVIATISYRLVERPATKLIRPSLGPPRPPSQRPTARQKELVSNVGVASRQT
jgi:peptidoglycan/LPS O-acetylase OafA/YrhL